MSNMHSTVDALIKLINQGDEVDRCFASKTLGIFQDKRAIPTLIERLRDEDIDVCIDAAEALGRINDHQAIPALLESLKHDPDGEMKTIVTEVLGKFNSAKALDALLLIAAGEPEDLIAEEGDDWNDWWDMQLNSVKALGLHKEKRAVPIFKTLLDDEDAQDIEPEILMALAQIGGEGINTLFDVLQTSGERSRRRAVYALGHDNSPFARKILGQALKEKAASVRAAAIESLKRAEATSYLDVILLMLKDNDAEVRRAALSAVASLGKAQIQDDKIHRISALLTDSNQDVLLNTLNILNQLVSNKLNNAQAITENDRENIRACLQHSSFSIQAAACSLLGTLKQYNALDDLLVLASDVEQHAMARREAINAIADIAVDHSNIINNELINSFNQWILDESQPVRQAALSNLLKLDTLLSGDNELSPTPMEIIIQAAQGELILEAEEETIPSTDKLDNISIVVNNSNEENTASENTSSEIDYQPIESEFDKQPAQQTAMSTLEALTMDNVELALAAEQQSEKQPEILSTEEKEEYQEYFDLVEANNNRAYKMKALKADAQTDAQYLSLRLLGEHASAESVNILINALDNDDAIIRKEAISSLGQIAKNTQPPKELLNALGRLITLMHSDVEDNRLASVITLGNMRHRAAIPEIITHLSDDDYNVRMHSIQALAKLCQLQIEHGDNDPEDQIISNDMPTEDILKAMATSLDDKESAVQMTAIESLLALREINQQDNELEKIIQIALNDQGAMTRRIAQLLRRQHNESAGKVLLEKMQAAEDSAHRRFIIEMLEELYKPEVLAA